MIKEHERVALLVPLPEYDLVPGDIGTVVSIYSNGKAYVVEFFAATGETIAVVPVKPDQIRPVTSKERLHVRTPDEAA